MREIVQHEKYGTIEYDENFLTGKKVIKINGVQLEKRGKNIFTFHDGEKFTTCSVSGNYLIGVKLAVDGQKIQLVKPLTWWEGVLAGIMLVFFIVWGNVTALCEMLPLAGGAIGGAITGFMTFSAMICMKLVKQTWAKPLIWLAFAGATLGINYGIALAILAVLV